MPDQPLLPRTAGGAQRPAAATPTDALSLDEAVQIYGLSISTLRRRLRASEVAGAYKVPGPKGEEWRIPRGALEELGYRTEAAEPEPTVPVATAAAPPDVAQALRAVADVLGQMRTQQLQLQAAEEDRGRAVQEREDARVQAAELRAQLTAAERERERLEADLARARRRWWHFGT